MEVELALEFWVVAIWNIAGLQAPDTAKSPTFSQQLRKALSFLIQRVRISKLERP